MNDYLIDTDIPEMPKYIYTLVFLNADKQISMPGLTLNGTCYVSSEKISDEIFNEIWETITISYSEGQETLYNVKVLSAGSAPDGYYMALNELDLSSTSNSRLRSDIDYIAMMSGVELI